MPHSHPYDFRTGVAASGAEADAATAMSRAGALTSACADAPEATVGCVVSPEAEARVAAVAAAFGDAFGS